ncbi:unnamed protein product [Mytilus coruscus]|uniref:Uncharacterized protein n=1 Tax=Mytilus coruscus TaxID=42192 RepID=A0A6J8D873_MYTCO|nr:unnamed protein product [Mytilus coruscus]
MTNHQIYLTTPVRLQHLLYQLNRSNDDKYLTLVNREENLSKRVGDRKSWQLMMNIFNCLRHFRIEKAKSYIKELASQDRNMKAMWFLTRFYIWARNNKTSRSKALRDLEEIMNTKAKDLNHKQELLNILKVISNRKKAEGLIHGLYTRMLKTAQTQTKEKDIFLKSYETSPKQNLIKRPKVSKDKEGKNKHGQTTQLSYNKPALKESDSNYNKENTLYSLIYLEDMVDRVQRGRSISSPSHHLEKFLEKHRTFKNNKSISGILDLLKRKEVEEARGLIKLLQQKILASVEKLKPKENRRRRSVVPHSDTVSILRRILLLKSFGIKRLNRLADKLTQSEVRITKLHPDPKYRYVVFKILRNIVNEKDKRASYLLDDFSNWLDPQGTRMRKPMKGSFSKSRTGNHILNKQYNGTMENEKLSNFSAIPYKSQSSSRHNSNNLKLYRNLPSNITLTFKQNININLFGGKKNSGKNSRGINARKLTNRHDRKLWQGKQRLQNKNELNHIDDVTQRQEKWRNLKKRYRELMDKEIKEKIGNETGSQNEKTPRRLQPTEETKGKSRKTYKNTYKEHLKNNKKMSESGSKNDIDQTISKLRPITLMHESKQYQNAKAAIKAERQTVKSLQKDLQRKVNAILQAVEEKNYFKAKHLILKLEVERELETLENFYTRKWKKTFNRESTRKSSPQTKNNKKIAKIEDDTESQNKKTPRRVKLNRLAEENNKISEIENEMGSQDKKASRRLKSTKLAKEKKKISEIDNETGSQNKIAPRRLKSTKKPKEHNKISEIENEKKTESHNKKAPKVSMSNEKTSGVGNFPTKNKHLKGQPNIRIRYKSKVTVGKEKRKQNHSQPEEKNPLDLMVSRLSSIITLKENKQTKRANEIIKTVRREMQKFSNVVKKKIDSILKYILEGEYIQAELLVIELEHPEESQTVSSKDRKTGEASQAAGSIQGSTDRETRFSNRQQEYENNLPDNQKSKRHNDERFESMELREMRKYKKHYRRLKRSVKEMTSYQIYLTTPYRLQNIMYKIKPVKCRENSDLIKSENEMMMRLPQGQFKRKVTSILNYLKHPYIHKAKRSLEQLASQDRSLKAMWFIRRIIHYYQPIYRNNPGNKNRARSRLVIRKLRREILNDRRKIMKANDRDLEHKKELLKILSFRIIFVYHRAKKRTTALYNKILNKKVPPEWKTKNMSTETEQKKVNDDYLTRYDKMENEKLIESIIYLLEKKQCIKATTLTSLLYRNIVKKVSKNKTKTRTVPNRGAELGGKQIHHRQVNKVKKVNKNETKNRTVPNQAAEFRGKQIHHRQVKGNISNLKERITYVTTPRRLKYIIQELREKRFHRNVTLMIKHEKAMLISSGDARFRKEMLNILDLLQENKTTQAEKLIESLVAKDSDLLTAWFLSRFKDYVNYNMWHFWHCVREMVSRDYDKIMKIKETNLKSKKELLDILKIIFSNRNKAHGMITALFERLSKTVPKIKQVSEKKIQDEDRFLAHNLKMVENIMLLLKKKQCSRAIVSTRILYMKLVGEKSRMKNISSLQNETLIKGHHVSKDKDNFVKDAKSEEENRLYTMYCLVYLEDMVVRVNRDQSISSPSRHLDDFLKKHNTFKYHKSISGIFHLLKKNEVQEAIGLIKLLKNRILPSVKTEKNPKKNRRKRSAVLHSDTILKLRRILALKSFGLNRSADNLIRSVIGFTKLHPDLKYRYVVFKILKTIVNDKDKRASSLLDNFSNRLKQQGMNLGKAMKESVSESRTDNHIFNTQYNGTMKNEKQGKILAKSGKFGSSSNYNRNNNEFYQKLPRTITLIVRPKFKIYLSGEKFEPLENSSGNNKIELKNRHYGRLSQGKQRFQHKKEQNHIDEVKQSQENRKNETNMYRALIDREKHNKNTKIENETGSQHKKASTAVTKDEKRQQKKDTKKLSKSKSKNKMTEPKNILSSKRQNLQKSQTTERIDLIDRTISELTSIASMQESKNYEKAKTAINAEKQKVKTLPKDLQRKIATVFQAIEEQNFFRARHLILQLQVEKEFEILENMSIQGKKMASGNQIKKQNKHAKIENETGSQNKKASRRLIPTKEPKEKNKNAKLENKTGIRNKKVSKRFKSNEVHKEKNKNAKLESETESQNKKASRRLKSTEMTSGKGNSPTNNKHLRRKPKMRITLKEKNKQTLGKEEREENHRRQVGLNSPEMVASRLSTIIALKENKDTKKATTLIKKERKRLSRLSNVVRQKVDSILNYILNEEYIKAKLLIIELEQSEVSPTVSGNDRNTEDITIPNGVHGVHAVQPVVLVDRKEDSSA